MPKLERVFEPYSEMEIQYVVSVRAYWPRVIEVLLRLGCVTEELNVRYG